MNGIVTASAPRIARYLINTSRSGHMYTKLSFACTSTHASHQCGTQYSCPFSTPAATKKSLAHSWMSELMLRSPCNELCSDKTRAWRAISELPDLIFNLAVSASSITMRGVLTWTTRPLISSRW